MNKGLWKNLDDRYKRSFITPISIDILKEALKGFLKDKPLGLKNEDKIPMYIPLTRDETLSLKDGDTCYIMSSYGMQKTTYPELSGDTHRNLFGKGGTDKTVEEKRDWGEIFKKNPDYE